MVLKSDIISDLDSLSTLLFDEMQEKLFALKDSTTLRNALIGKWRLKSIERVNGIPFKLQSYENIQFSEQGEFILENINDTVRGRWNLVNARNGNLLYKYNKPQLAVKDKEILKLLSEEQITPSTVVYVLLNLCSPIPKFEIFKSLALKIPSANLNALLFKL